MKPVQEKFIMLKIIVGLILFTGQQIFAHAKDEIIWLDYPPSGVTLGQGYNLLKDTPSHGTCIEFIAVQDPSQETTYRFDKITSKTEMLSKMKISASGKLKMALVNASAKLSFTNNEEFKSNYEKYQLKAQVTNSALFTAPASGYKRGVRNMKMKTLTGDEQETEFPTLENNAIEMMPNTQGNIGRCGHGFVAGIVSGAEIDAFITMTKDDAKSLSKVSGSLKADIAKVFTVSGSLNSTNKLKSVKENMTISVYKVGGSGGNLAFDFNELKTELKSLPDQAKKAPRPVKIAVVPYSELAQVTNSDKSVDAVLFEDTTNAYFMALDVFQRTQDVISEYENIVSGPSNNQNSEGEKFPIPIYLHKVEAYEALNGQAMGTASMLSKYLTICSALTDDQSRKQDEQDETQRITAQNQLFDTLSSNTAFFTVEGNPALADHTVEIGDLVPGPDAVADAVHTSQRYKNLQGYYRNFINNVANGELQACAVQSEFGESALLLAVDLMTAEISLRPILYTELDERYQTRIGDANKVYTTAVGPGTTAVAVAAAAEARFLANMKTLNEHNNIYRSSQYLRGICEANFRNTLCMVNTQGIQEKARLSKSPDVYMTAGVPENPQGR